MRDDEAFYFWVVVVAMIFTAAGAIAGGRRDRAFLGGMLGFLLGPLGVLIAFGLEGGRLCPCCGSRVRLRAPTCSNCAAILEWSETSNPQITTVQMSRQCPSCKAKVSSKMRIEDVGGLWTCPACKSVTLPKRNRALAGPRDSEN